MNICFASLSYPAAGQTSGVATQVHLLAHALSDAGNSVSVIASASGRSASISKDRGVEMHEVVTGRLHWFAAKLPLIGSLLVLPLRELEYSLALWRGVRQVKAIRKLDIVEGGETGMVLIALLMRRVPFVIRLHGEQYTFLKYTPGSHLTAGLRLTRALQRLAMRRARLLISPSEAHAREIQKELGNSGVPIVVVPNAVDVHALKRNPSITRDAQTVLYVGRIERRKGISILLEAAAEVKQRGVGIHLVIVGGSHSSYPVPEFQFLVRRLGLENDITLLGPLEWKSVSEWYQRAAISVLPSYYETFGVAALESMMFGTPVVATAASALPEVIDDEATGKLVPAGDVTALAAAITQLLKDHDLRKKMGEAAMKRARLFDIARLLPVNDKLYHLTGKPVLEEESGGECTFKFAQVRASLRSQKP